MGFWDFLKRKKDDPVPNPVSSPTQNIIKKTLPPVLKTNPVSSPTTPTSNTSSGSSRKQGDNYIIGGEIKLSDFI